MGGSPQPDGDRTDTLFSQVRYLLRHTVPQADTHRR
jgi:hypothetical protein